MIEQILENNEKIIWKWKQDFKSTMIISFIFFFVLIIPSLLIYFIIWNEANNMDCTINWKPGTPEECWKIVNIFSLIFFSIWLIVPIIRYLSYLVTEYAVTHKRLIIKSWIIWADIRSIYFEQIRSIFVNVWIIWKIFKTWSIFIDTGKINQTKNWTSIIYDRFDFIDNPYDVYKKVQEVISEYKEANSSWRSDFENNKSEYKDFIQETERFKKGA